MIKISRMSQLEKISSILPKSITASIEVTLRILDEAYGVARDPIKDLGGYVIIFQSPEELDFLKEHYLDPDNLIPEYVDRITVDGDEDWSNSLILLSSDFSLSLYMPITMLPPCLSNSLE